MTIIGPELALQVQCEAVLRSLPDWFGVDDAIRRYAADSQRLPTFAVEDDGVVAASLTLKQHFPESAQIHCVAVHLRARHGALGTALLDHAQQWLRSRAVKYLQAKTIAAEHSSQAYVQTREFYLARGFVRRCTRADIAVLGRFSARVEPRRRCSDSGRRPPSQLRRMGTCTPPHLPSRRMHTSFMTSRCAPCAVRDFAFVLYDGELGAHGSQSFRRPAHRAGGVADAARGIDRATPP